MDYTRFILYTSLALITYLMLLAWQEDYPVVVNTNPVTTVGLGDVADTGVTSPLSDIPTQVPQAPDPLNQASQTESVEEIQGSQSPAPKLVSITTDTLSLSIDLNGGDIVYLALPQYRKQIDVADDPFVLLVPTNSASYVAQSGLIGRNGIDNVERASYQSAAEDYQLRPNEDSLAVDLTTRDPNGILITKRFTFHRDSYVIDISFEIDNNTDQLWQANAFGQIKRDNFEDPSNLGSFSRTYLGFVTTSIDDPYIKIQLDDIDEGVTANEMTGGWIGFSQHYFVTAWIPDTNSINQFSTRTNSANQYIGGFTGSAIVAEPNSTTTHTVQYYAGPKDQYVLRDLSPNLDLTIDYGFLWFLASPIYWLLTRINSIVSNFGVSIILLTFVVKGAFYKLSESQYRSIAGMRRLMPKIQQLKESYADDKMKLQKATMDLYKKEKLNPLGGCLPLLVQMPVFISLYWVLLESVELRQAPFFLWLQDLSVRDPFFILPLLMGAAMFLQTSMSPAPADPMQANVMKFMPVMMTLFFLWFPAGLVLYWLTNSALGIVQQWYITRKVEAAYEASKGH
ncbi:MAG: membrane protein insertase YidC [Gammaproteobacteria bacterium]|jgi:YidC/Oxa1 family membrane protein insertase|nr:membrane protein insertase YidC [Gammaproteobacteria bacterium]MDP7455566.1 membrane protein insertase YidC [Gammaproteobacteria bacterium]